MSMVVNGIVAGISGGNDSTSNSTGSSQSNVGSTDPIEQARVVLGGRYSYDQVKTVTDDAIRASGLGLTNDNRSRAWSAALAVTKDSSVRPMDVMKCVPSLYGAAPALALSDAIAICFTDLSIS